MTPMPPFESRTAFVEGAGATKRVLVSQSIIVLGIVFTISIVLLWMPPAVYAALPEWIGRNRHMMAVGSSLVLILGAAANQIRVLNKKNLLCTTCAKYLIAGDYEKLPNACPNCGAKIWNET
jgi:hypothetical protein